MDTTRSVPHILLVENLSILVSEVSKLNELNGPTDPSKKLAESFRGYLLATSDEYVFATSVVPFPAEILSLFPNQITMAENSSYDLKNASPRSQFLLPLNCRRLDLPTLKQYVRNPIITQVQTDIDKLNCKTIDPVYWEDVGGHERCAISKLTT